MKYFEFAIIASGFDPDGAYEDALFDAGCSDATLIIQKGVLIAEFDREAVSFSQAVASAYANVTQAGLLVERIEPDHLVSLSEIAERSELSRQAISLFASGKRQEGFPGPTAKVTSKHPLWDWQKVAAWLYEKTYVSKDILDEAIIVKEANIILSSKNTIPDEFQARLNSIAS